MITDVSTYFTYEGLYWHKAQGKLYNLQMNFVCHMVLVPVNLGVSCIRMCAEYLITFNEFQL